MLTTCYTGRLRFHRRLRFQRHRRHCHCHRHRHRFRYCDYEKATQERLKSYQAKAKKKGFLYYYFSATVHTHSTVQFSSDQIYSMLLLSMYVVV